METWWGVNDGSLNYCPFQHFDAPLGAVTLSTALAKTLCNLLDAHVSFNKTSQRNT
jgi:hypothetical protein